jgi:hypothetical protein
VQCGGEEIAVLCCIGPSWRQLFIVGSNRQTSDRLVALRRRRAKLFFNPAKLWSQARGAVCLLVCAISEVLLVPRTHQLISSKFPGFNYHFAE